MKAIVLALVAGVLVGWSPARADEAGKEVKIEEMLRLSHVDRTVTQMLDQMKTMMTAQMSKADVPAADRKHMDEIQTKIMALMADRLSWEKSKSAYVKIYSETYTESEIDGLLAFYKSPAGQAMIDKMPELMQKSMALSQQMMGDIMPEIKRLSQEKN